MREIGSRVPAAVLCVRLRRGGFTFYVVAAGDKRAEREEYAYAGAEGKAERLARAARESPLVRGKDIGAVYALATGAWACIPLECFRKEEAPRWLRLIYSGGKETGRTYYNILPHVETAVVFVVEGAVERTLKTQFPDVRFYHSMTMVMEKLSQMPRQGRRALYVCFDEERAAVFAFDADERLEYANEFPADVPENAAYYILSVWKDLGLDVRKDEVALLGAGALKEAAGRLLRKYVGVVRDVQAGDIYRKPLSAEGGAVPADVQALLANVS